MKPTTDPTKLRWQWMPDNSCTFAASPCGRYELVVQIDTRETGYRPQFARRGPYTFEVTLNDGAENVLKRHQGRKTYDYVDDARAAAARLYDRARKRLVKEAFWQHVNDVCEAARAKKK